MTWKKLQITKAELSDLKNIFRKKAKFYADENIEEELIGLLKNIGWNIESYKDYSLAGQPDENQFSKAQQLKRMLITKDPDFWDNKKFPIYKHPGVIILECKNDQRLGASLRFISDVILPFAEIWNNSKVRIRGEEIAVFSKDADRGIWDVTRYKLDKNGIPFIWENAIA